MDLADLVAVVADLRDEGSDLSDVEVKLAASGYPQTLTSTLSAFANTPGGGTVILGLEEKRKFAAVGVYDVAACKSALAASARQAVAPPVMVDFSDFVLEDATVVVAAVHELPASGKPCRVRSSGKAYLRSYDGDYELSEVEEQAFIANRSTPRFDREPVPSTSLADLDPGLLTSYLSFCRSSSSALSAFKDDELLYRTGVTVGTQRSLSLAGLLALGAYPQQYIPNFVIQASVAPGPGDPPGTRASDARRFDGPIPVMLDEALRWVQRNTRTRVRFGPGGHVRDEPEFPVEAVRELLSNALIHRDLGPYSLGEAVTLKLDNRQLMLSNPGGLWGITVDRLGTVGVTSARNGQLLRICQNVRTSEGSRVIEALASGIPTVLRSLSDAGMVAPRFHDQGIRFTVLMPNHTLLANEDIEWLASLSPQAALSDQQRHALVAMRHGVTWTNQSLRDSFPMDSREVTRVLAGLVEAGVAVAEGERGGRVYRLAEALLENRQQPSLEGLDGQTEVKLPNSELIIEALSERSLSMAEILAKTGLTRRQADYALRDMRARGQVVLHGRRGIRASSYELVPAPLQSP